MNYAHDRFGRPHRQGGHAAVEYAAVALLFFVFLFVMIEASRALYMWNTMTEVTRRAARVAAVSAFDSGTKALIRQQAMFNGTSLPMAADIKHTNVVIDYLQSDAVTPVVAMPLCPTENLINCTANPNGPSCIRFVRVRMCTESGCAELPYSSLTGLDQMIPGSFTLPRFTTISPVGSLGRNPGITTTCP